jgi:hypothetical protein
VTVTSRLDADHAPVAGAEVQTGLTKAAAAAFGRCGFGQGEWWQTVNTVTTVVLGLLTRPAPPGARLHNALLFHQERARGRSHLRVHPALVPTDPDQHGWVVGEDYSLIVEGGSTRGFHVAGFDFPTKLTGLIEQVSMQVAALASRHEHARRSEVSDLVARATILHAFETRTLPQRLLPFAVDAYFHDAKGLAAARTMAGLYWALASTAHRLKPQPKLACYLRLGRLLPRLQPSLFDGPVPDMEE